METNAKKKEETEARNATEEPVLHGNESARARARLKTIFCFCVSLFIKFASSTTTTRRATKARRRTENTGRSFYPKKIKSYRLSGRLGDIFSYALLTRGRLYSHARRHTPVCPACLFYYCCQCCFSN